MRGIASAYVMIAHCRGILWIGGSKFLEENPVESWSLTDYLIFSTSLSTRLAVEFVILFFVLSGFSIAYSLKRNSHSISFYKKRLIRIYPPYLLALVWAGIVFIITQSMHPDFYSGTYATPTFERYRQMLSFFELETILGNLLYLPSSGFIVQFWSLSHEVIFYALAPLLILNKYWYYRVSLFLFLLYITFKNAIPFEDSILTQFIGVYNFYFCIGMLLFDNFSKGSDLIRRIRKIPALLLTGLVLLCTYGINFMMESETLWSFIPAGITGCLLILIFLTFKIKIKWLINLGRHSYSLYITHFASIILFHSIYYSIVPKESLPYIDRFYVFFLAIPFCLVVSYLFYHLIEKKTKDLLSKIRLKT
ncbi:MAG: acyltransferase [Ekhidna sp.]